MLWFFTPIINKLIFLCVSLAVKEKPVKFPVIGRPILLALEDVDGTPSFLEKAIRFIEEHGEFFFFYAV